MCVPIILFGLLIIQGLQAKPLPTSASWKLLKSNAAVFTERNSHATCVFNNKIYLIGGRTNIYPYWDLQLTDKAADVWVSLDGRKTYIDL